MPSLTEFSRRMAIRAGRIEGNTTKLVRKTALVVDTILVTETPVDTGRAKANWLVSMNLAMTGAIDAYAPGEGGATAGANESAALAQGEAVIRQYTSGLGMSIHIANNLPYIGRLNEGSSLQAPAGFVEAAINSAVSYINNSNVRIIGP